ncbi:hypothetical protein AB0383_19675 [Amycolatopsis sp. NPDC051373]|uniref:hypothetical protein n=1 Tax=Amycolatopsis sp. NPDC051373 TaxID=3155801 RepID=UPI00344BE71B
MTAPGGDFKLASAYVEVNLRDNTTGDEKKIRARIEGEKPVNLDTALNDPKNAEIVKRKISSGKPVQISADLDDKLAQAKADEFVAKRRSAVIDLDANIAKLRTKLEELNQKRGTSVEVDADIRKAEAELAALAARRRTVQLEVQAKTKPAEDEISRMAKRANAQFDALKFTGLSVGLPAAAAVGAAGVAVSLAVISAGFLALGVSAAASSDEVQSRVSALSARVQSDVKDMSAPLQGQLVDAVDKVGVAWGRLEPQVAAAVQASGGYIDDLVGGVTDLAEGAMPGLLVAVHNAGPVFSGFRSLLGQTGDGLGEFAANASQGAGATDRALSQLGGTVQLLESRFGTLLANLANASTGPLASLHVAVDDVTASAVSLTSQGSGALGFLQGFTNTGTGALTVIRLLASAVSLLPADVTQLGGALTASNLILSKFGVDAGKNFEGLGAKIKAAKGPTDKLTTAVGGLIEGAFTPAGLAVAALGIGLDLLGQHQQQAAAAAQAHKDRVNDLAQALAESNGVIDSNVRASAAATLQDFEVGDGKRNLLRDVKNLTGGTEDLQKAYLGDTDAQKRVVAQLRETQKAHTHTVDTGHGLVTTEDQVGKAARETADIIDGANSTFGDAVAKNKELAEATDDTAQGFDKFSARAANATTAFNTLAVAGGDWSAKGAAIVTILDQITGGVVSQEDALQAWNDHLRSASESFKDLKLPVHAKDFISTAGAINTASEAGSNLQNFVEQGATDMASYAQALKDGGAGADEITAKLKPMRKQLEDQLRAWGLNDKQIQTILDHYAAIPDKITTVLEVSGGEQAKAQVQEVITTLLGLPAEKGFKVTGLTQDAVKNLQDLGYKIVQLPNGDFVVYANTAAGQQGMNDFLANNKDAKSVVSVGADTGPAEVASSLFIDYVGSVVGTLKIDGNTLPANNKLQVQVANVDGTTATMTYDARRDPATKQLEIQVQDVNGARGWMTIDAFNSAAKSVIDGTVRVANGSKGWIQVGANTGPANSQIGAFVADQSRRRINIGVYTYTVDGTGTSTSRSYGPRAAGGIDVPAGVVPMATGGVIPRIPNIATVVQPGMERLIGDNKRVPESFIPWDINSARSNAILDRTNQAFGRGTGRGSDGATVEQHFHIYPPADSDPRRIAASVSGEVGWAVRGI